ncbi:MAG: bifunctional anthranilate synthase component I family protein/class IV aminotransferase [Magnetococcales bacterium]|nr:bifunctional anthranilate synthase component I family protein/class IV aminotransferase [Magnetococcales bacterium]
MTPFPNVREGVCLLVDFPELGSPLVFTQPHAILEARTSDEVVPLLREVERAVGEGAWVGGFLAYEAAAAFGLPVLAPADDFPLAWFAFFTNTKPFVYPSLDVTSPLPTLMPLLTRERYRSDLARIAERIAAGDTYQVNYTLEARAEGDFDPLRLFLRLQCAHRFPRAMWIETPAWRIASLSPETFLVRQGDRLMTAPIKGTRPRGGTPEEDLALGRLLEGSEKERAEHVMIVDMARHDLGKIGRIGSVRAGALMERRLFSTVQHLESRVEGRLSSGIGLSEIMAAMFPAASITGAPKWRTMEIIRDLERRPRGVYTGCMGILQPGGSFWFNVAIRTLVWRGEGRLGLGGGVVADSRPEREWEEIVEKGRFVERTPDFFALIETFLVGEGGEVFWLARHLARMAFSAGVLGFPWDRLVVERLVVHRVGQWRLEGVLPCVGRLSLAHDGSLELTRRSVVPWSEGLRVCIADWHPDPRDPLLGHKTTRRREYDLLLDRARCMGYDEVLFVTAGGVVTEGAISALLVELDGRWYVSPVGWGVLPSLWRADVMERCGAEERSLTLADLAHARAIWLGNAVRGSGRVVRLEGSDGELIFASQLDDSNVNHP